MQGRLATITRLERGAHKANSTFCIQEAIAFVNGEEWTDRPKCCCPVLAVFTRALNDTMPDDQRQRLISYIPLLIGSKSSPKVAQQRAFILADFAVRVIVPIALRHVDLHEQAETLEGLAEIIDEKSAEYAARSARYAAESAGQTVWDRALEGLDKALAIKEEEIHVN